MYDKYVLCHCEQSDKGAVYQKVNLLNVQWEEGFCQNVVFIYLPSLSI